MQVLEIRKFFFMLSFMNQPVTACLIIIGNEILSGRTQDKNLNWLALQLNAIGVKLAEARVIPDIEATIIATLNECRKRHNYVFTTGGIGPTHDDITAASVAKALGLPLTRHPEAEKILRAHYKPEDINAARLKMANTPQGATLIANPVSAAPGFRIENVFVLAGVPKIMQAMFDDLKSQLKGGDTTLSRTLNINLPEGTIAEGLTKVQANFPEVEIGSYPHFQHGLLSVSLVMRSPDKTKLDECFVALEDFLRTLGAEMKEVA